jgi:hypothetical protein
MAKFSNSRDLKKHLKKATDALVAEVIVTTQARLGSDKISPKDSGRLRSSWFASEGTPSNEVPPEGTDSANTDATGLRVDSDKTYFLTSNLPYTQEITLGMKAVNKPATWFISEINEGIPRTADKAAKVIKGRFKL